MAHCVLEYLRARFLNHVGVSSSHKYFLCVHGYIFYAGAYLLSRCLSNRAFFFNFFFIMISTLVGNTNVVLYRQEAGVITRFCNKSVGQGENTASSRLQLWFLSHLISV